jgi:hypothetical protein
MDRLHVIALSYHSWLDLAAVLFFLLCISYPVTDKERAISEEETYG